jgi:hypothetical protein
VKSTVTCQHLLSLVPVSALCHLTLLSSGSLEESYKFPGETCYLIISFKMESPNSTKMLVSTNQTTKHHPIPEDQLSCISHSVPYVVPLTVSFLNPQFQTLFSQRYYVSSLHKLSKKIILYVLNLCIMECKWSDRS